jgi:hypothetical protein
MLKQIRWIGLMMEVAGLMLATGNAWAGCDSCQVCKEASAITIPRDYCALANNQNGQLCCQTVDTGAGTYCYTYGSDCYGIIVNGGGGGAGGSGGSGSTCSYQNGWCPAECMSCSGGTGGRPAY